MRGFQKRVSGNLSVLFKIIMFVYFFLLLKYYNSILINMITLDDRTSDLEIFDYKEQTLRFPKHPYPLKFSTP